MFRRRKSLLVDTASLAASEFFNRLVNTSSERGSGSRRSSRRASTTSIDTIHVKGIADQDRSVSAGEQVKVVVIYVQRGSSGGKCVRSTSMLRALKAGISIFVESMQEELAFFTETLVRDVLNGSSN